MHRMVFRGAVAAGLAVALAACGGPSRKEITEKRTVSDDMRGTPPRLSAQQRLGVQEASSDMAAAHAGMSGMMGGGMPPAGMMGGGGMPPAGMGGMPPMASPHGTAAGSAPLSWTAPDTWLEAPERPMRAVTFSAAEGTVECYVSILGGAAGGLAANVNRWRAQMGQPDLDEAAIAALPEIAMLGTQARVADIEGEYTGMDGKARPDYRMLGTVCSLDDKAVFVKMIGPKDAVAAEKDHFLAFCGSLSKKGN